MIWPPLKAWTRMSSIENQIHFVAINYGGKLLERWVILMSVLDSDLVIKVYWPELVDPSSWKCGWDEYDFLKSSEFVEKKCRARTSICACPSIDSGLTVPITKNIIRPWFTKT
tara:strand:+ start:6132 stop:6470 length:339 start_codon:yes stop_codon:yes gene_type:complete